MTGWAMPAVDVSENERGYLVTADLPGVQKNDVNIEVKEQRLWLQATRAGIEYKRSFRLPQGIDESGISANLEDGVLNVMIPKAESTLPRQIEVVDAS